MGSTIIKQLSTQNSTINNHEWSLPAVDVFANDYRTLSFTISPMGQKFVSSMEQKSKPIYGMQFHAEKPIFEWIRENINHTFENVLAMSYFSHFVVSEAVKNNHVFDENFPLNLIYGYSASYTGNQGVFEQTYFFNSWNKN